MTTAVRLAQIVALLAAAVMCAAGVGFLRALERETEVRIEITRQVPVILHREVELIRADIGKHLTAARRDAREELAATREMIDGRLESITVTADNRLAAIQSDLVPMAASVAQETTLAIREYRRVPEEIGRRLEPWTDCTGNGNCWQSQITATLGATRATMGAVAKAAPGISAAMDRSASSTEKATSATAEAMKNIAEVSRPLPRWVRVPLQILGPTTPIWLPFTIK